MNNLEANFEASEGRFPFFIRAASCGEFNSKEEIKKSLPLPRWERIEGESVFLTRPVQGDL
jgi:hypothetical protein